MKRKTYSAILATLLSVVLLSGCGAFAGESENGAITASGSISAETVQIALELGGTVVEVLVNEGDTVLSGDVLLRLDGAFLDAQFAQAEAAVAVGESGLEAARAQHVSAELQAQLALQGARLQEAQLRESAWSMPSPSAFELPNWYFDQEEQIAAVQAEIEAAEEALDLARAELQSVLEDASSDDFLAVEARLALAQIRYDVASATLAQARSARERAELEDAASAALDVAEAELEAVQLEYERMLSTSAAAEVLEARAAAAVARARLEYALDQMTMLQTGEESLQVRAAEAAAAAAGAAVAQAEAGLAQAQAALEVLSVQQDKMTLYAPISGTVMARGIETGELASPGATLFTIADLDAVSLTVYIPENQYGRISLGQEVQVSVDSFPNELFSGTVVRIADEAEFTPRSVQTVEGRRTTVYAVVISLDNPEQALKPGMPADVVFLEE
ncbi:MAG: efflux RND transporter periplasmic adaptor subunit [Anaerolineales bacterium]|nr:efflux RND transporter periplasmic adaptor subunit [Anaerolineales bacterium]